MKLKDSRLEELSDPVLKLKMELEADLLNSVGYFFSTNQDLLEDNPTQWQLKKLDDLGALTRANAKRIALQSERSEKEVLKMMESVGFEAVELQEETLKGAPVATTPPPIKQDPALLETLAVLQANATDKNNLTNTTLISMFDQKSRDIINKTTTEALLGIITPQQALRRNLVEFSKSGFPAMIDKSGREWSLEAVTFMTVRTTTNQVTAEMQMERTKSYNVDLIEISSKAGSRPKCAPYQGRIFSLSGNHEKYPAYSTTSYGEIDGLFGANCGHQQYPFWEGKSRQTFHEYDEEENDRIYKESQQQRALEREIRKSKKQLAFLKSSGFKDNPIEEARIRRNQAKMRAFLDDTGRTRRYDREQIAVNYQVDKRKLPTNDRNWGKSVVGQ